MRIADMIGLLEQARETYGDDVEVCVAIQEYYPITADVYGVWAQYESMGNDGRLSGAVWITTTSEGRASAPREAWDMSETEPTKN